MTNYLPTAAADKLAELRLNVAEQRGAHDALYKALMAANNRLDEYKAILRRHDENIRLTPRYLSDNGTDHQREEYLLHIADCEADVARLQRRYSEAGSSISPLSGLLDKVNKFVEGLSAPVDMVPAPTPRSVTVAEVDRLRGEIKQIDNEMIDARYAFRPREDAETIVRLSVQNWAREAATSVSATAEALSQPSIFPSGIRALEPRHIESVLAWLFPDVLQARLNDELDSIYAGETGLSPAERDKKLALLRSKKLSVERTEEAIILALEAKNTAVTRRVDVSPEAFLQVESPNDK